MSNGANDGNQPLPEEAWQPLERHLDIEIDIEPVRHSSSQKFKDFVQAFRAALAPHVWQKFIGEVHVEWTLYQDEFLRYDSDRIADLDNLVKGLNDAIKGPRGIMVDDSQIQSLHVSWLPRYGEGDSCIRLRVDGGTELLAMREPIRFYEMQNGRYYPLQSFDPGSDSEQMLLDTLHSTIQLMDESIRKIYGDSASPEDAYRLQKQIGPPSSGFVKSRVADSGFELVAYKEWRPRVPSGPVEEWNHSGS